MNELKIFQFEDFGEIRTLMEGDKVLFCGNDVAKALGYTKPRNAISTHCRGALKRGVGVETGTKRDGTAAIQEVNMLFIPEGDVYRLITHCKLPRAILFERWVYDEVLPAMRKGELLHNGVVINELRDLNKNMLNLVGGVTKLAEKVTDIERRVSNLENGGGQASETSMYEINVEVKRKHRRLPSLILQMPLEIQNLINEMIDNYVKYEEISKKITSKGYSVSSSAVGRYALKYVNNEL